MKKLLVFAAFGVTVCLLAACHKKPETTPPSKPKAKPPVKAAARPSPPAKATPAKAPAKTNVFLGAVPGTISYLDFKNGFRDVVFGRSPSAISNLVLKTQDESRQLKTFTRRGETLALNGVPLTSVEYVFFNDQLYQVRLKWRVAQNDTSRLPSVTLAQFCGSLYGAPKRPTTRKGLEEHDWRGQRVHLIIRETLVPGVKDPGKLVWVMPPTASGFMLIENVDLRKTMQLVLTAGAEQKKDGL